MAIMPILTAIFETHENPAFLEHIPSDVIRKCDYLYTLSLT